jgi:hypothetical protein
LNTIDKTRYANNTGIDTGIDTCIDTYKEQIYEEPEARDSDFCCIYDNTKIKSSSRTVSENLLDIMHIAFVHTFGNNHNPLPLNDIHPVKDDTNPNHYKTTYIYESGQNSIANKVYSINHVIVENEFILPHTVISRVKFDKNTKTIVTNALPVDENHTQLFIKVYRNFWYIKSFLFLEKMYNCIGDYLIMMLLKQTVKEDKDILENISPEERDGKYNMKYDKFPYMYRQLYNKYVRKQDKSL